MNEGEGERGDRIEGEKKGKRGRGEERERVGEGERGRNRGREGETEGGERDRGREGETEGGREEDSLNNDSELAAAELWTTCNSKTGGFQRGRSEGFKVKKGEISSLDPEFIDPE